MKLRTWFYIRIYKPSNGKVCNIKVFRRSSSEVWSNYYFMFQNNRPKQSLANEQFKKISHNPLAPFACMVILHHYHRICFKTHFTFAEKSNKRKWTCFDTNLYVNGNRYRPRIHNTLIRVRLVSFSWHRDILWYRQNPIWILFYTICCWIWNLHIENGFSFFLNIFVIDVSHLTMRNQISTKSNIWSQSCAILLCTGT